MKKILVTGFGPFLQHRENPSQVIVDQLQIPEVETLILPVNYTESRKQLREVLSSQKYKFVLALGLSSGRTKISLERVALNWQESAVPDNSGQIPERGPLYPKDAAALFSPVPLMEWKQKMLDERFPVEVSFSAGAYVCNAVYYELLKHQREGMQGLFVHVPEFTVISESTQKKSLNFLLGLVQQL